MGNDNGNAVVLPNFDLNNLLNLDPASLFGLAAVRNKPRRQPFSYGNNTFIMGDDNQGTGNNVMLGAGNFGNNMHFIGDNADLAGNNIVAGSLGSNMSIIGDSSSVRQQPESRAFGSPTTSASSEAEPRDPATTRTLRRSAGSRRTS